MNCVACWRRSARRTPWETWRGWQEREARSDPTGDTPEASLPPHGESRRSALSYYIPGSPGPSAMSRRSSARVSVMSSWYVSEARMTEITVMSAIAAV
jgi:hypothetical protein